MYADRNADNYPVPGVGMDATIPEMKSAHRKFVVDRRLDEVNDELLKAHAREVFPEVMPPDGRQDSPRASNDNGVKFQTKERRRSSLVKDDFSDLDLEEDFESYYDGYEGRGITRHQGRKTNERRGSSLVKDGFSDVDLREDFESYCDAYGYEGRGKTQHQTHRDPYKNFDSRDRGTTNNPRSPLSPTYHRDPYEHFDSQGRGTTKDPRSPLSPTYHRDPYKHFDSQGRGTTNNPRRPLSPTYHRDPYEHFDSQGRGTTKDPRSPLSPTQRRDAYEHFLHSDLTALDITEPELDSQPRRTKPDSRRTIRTTRRVIVEESETTEINPRHHTKHPTRRKTRYSYSTYEKVRSPTSGSSSSHMPSSRHRESEVRYRENSPDHRISSRHRKKIRGSRHKVEIVTPPSPPSPKEKPKKRHGLFTTIKSYVVGKEQSSATRGSELGGPPKAQ
ncbi:hypothetical protein V8E54_013070 [Elaphomyces granulatus]